MLLSEVVKDKIRNILNLITLVAGIVLLISVSWVVIVGKVFFLGHHYMTIQLVVCLLFLLDFFVRMEASPHRGRFFLHNSFFLLVSIPYLNIVSWYGLHLPQEVMMLVGTVPMLRTFLASYVVMRWFSMTRISQIFFTYIFIVFVFNYLAALTFYSYESHLNPDLHGFGNALWWAWMNFSTVGANVFAVTWVGKVLSVLLPVLGMMMFPIITTYVMQEYSGKKKSGQ